MMTSRQCLVVLYSCQSVNLSAKLMLPFALTAEHSYCSNAGAAAKMLIIAIHISVETKRCCIRRMFCVHANIAWKLHVVVVGRPVDHLRRWMDETEKRIAFATVLKRFLCKLRVQRPTSGPPLPFICERYRYRWCITGGSISMFAHPRLCAYVYL